MVCSATIVCLKGDCFLMLIPISQNTSSGLVTIAKSSPMRMPVKKYWQAVVQFVLAPAVRGGGQENVLVQEVFHVREVLGKTNVVVRY